MARNKDAMTVDAKLLSEWCRVVFQYLGSHGDAQTQETCERMTDVVGRESENPKALKSIARDLEEWTRVLPPGEITELDDVLRGRFAVGLKEAQRSRTKAVGIVLERNSIETDGEYRLLLSHVDDIHSDSTKSGEVERINALLRAYDGKKKRKSESA